MSQKNHSRTVLLIGGSDSGGGAGLQADLRALYAHGVAGACVVTAATAQNPAAVRALNALPARQVMAQLDAVLDDLDIAAIKIGMLGNAAIARAVYQRIRDCRVPIVLDPVMIATSGGRLASGAAVHVLRDQLLPLATVVTPNLPEAAALLGRPLPSLREREAAARALVAMGSACALVKGGHGDGAHLVDIVAGHERIERHSARRLAIVAHGTGCTYASAIAAGLALGADPFAAIAQAHAYLQAALRVPLRLGSGGVCSPGFVAPPGMPSGLGTSSARRGARSKP